MEGSGQPYSSGRWVVKAGSEMLGRCRALCDEFESHGYRLRSAPSR